jgi:nitrate/nitrite transport system substrate-binding protein
MARSHAVQKAGRQGRGNLEGLAALMKKEPREYTFAQTFPTGTHAMWLYYWLAGAGINPFKDVKSIVVPPPQMVANMRVGNMDGFSVGEPWNHRAIMRRHRCHGHQRRTCGRTTPKRCWAPPPTS